MIKNCLDIVLQELQKSSVLTNARLWGVKILYMDVILYYKIFYINGIDVQINLGLPAMKFSPQQMALC